MRLPRAILLAIFLTPGLIFAQEATQTSKPASKPTPAYSPGFTAFAQFEGKATPLGTVLNAYASVGRNFTSHFGADIGMPFYFVRSPFPLVTNHDWRWSNLIGDPSLDLRYMRTFSGVHYTTVLTGTFPVASSVRIFSTGRAGVDWFNHFEFPYKKLTPFVNLGVANGTVDRHILPRPYNIARPYQTLGLISNGEIGATYEVHHGIRLGASLYALLPSGQQKVFSRLVAPDSVVAGDFAHNRYFYSAFETTGPAKVARDNGYSGWLELTRMHSVTLQIGYSRSVHYAYDAVTVMLNIDATPLVKYPTQ